MDRRRHWDERYGTSSTDELSWFEDPPTTSLELIAAVSGPSDSVLDVGGGASTLVDHLIRSGRVDVSVLDLSEVALAEARTRVGLAAGVAWINADLLEWQPDRRWDVWHDRAVLHFLTDDDDRAVYVRTLREAVAPGGGVVIGTFAEDGPTHCSALPVRRQGPEDLVELLGDVEVVEERRVIHRTPAGVEQPFTWVAARLEASELEER